MIADVTLSISSPPYSSGISTDVSPSSAASLISLRVTAKSFASIAGDLRHHLIRRKVSGRLRNLPLLLGKVLREEAVRRSRIRDQKRSAGNTLTGGMAAVVVAMVLTPSIVYVSPKSTSSTVPKLSSVKGTSFSRAVTSLPPCGFSRRGTLHSVHAASMLPYAIVQLAISVTTRKPSPAQTSLSGPRAVRITA